MSERSSIVHHHMLAGLVERGCVPSTGRLATLTGLSIDDVRTTVRHLEAGHALVLHPGTEDVWVIPPFSLVPTAFWVENEERGWWASCIWCALGVCALVGKSPRIHTRIAGETEEVVIDPSTDPIEPEGLCAHFPIPVSRAWDNVHRFCGSTLVFRDREQIEAWCARHSFTQGDVQPLEKVRALAAAWYGGHLEPDWKKWTTSQAAHIFRSLSLTGETWWVPEDDARF